MPKCIYLPRDGECRGSGISIRWTPSAQRLDFDGWYDSCVGIEGEAFTLREFFDVIGITEKDCKRAFSAFEGKQHESF